jgi:hypothetical protein
MVEYTVNHIHIVLLILVLINQLLNDIPALKGNTIFTLFRGLVKSEAAREEAELAKVVSDAVK